MVNTIFYENDNYSGGNTLPHLLFKVEYLFQYLSDWETTGTTEKLR